MTAVRMHGALLVACVAGMGSGRAQDPVTPTPAVSAEALAREMAKLRAQIEALEGSRAEDRAQIRELQDQLAALQDLQQLPPPELAPPDPLQGGAPAAIGAGNLLNPQIAVIGDFLGSLSTSDSKALNRFALREIELDARAAITPWVDGVLIATFAEEVEEEPGGDISIENFVGIEEGYANFHTLPFDLSLKAGKFHNEFGRNNLLHLHDLPQIDRPPAVQAFLGHDAMITVGASLSWIVPNPWDEYVELRTEIVNADGGEEAPLLGGPNADSSAAVTHLKWFTDVGETDSLEVGGSYLFTPSSSRSGFDSHLLGIDLTYLWLNPEQTSSVLLQGELFYADADLEDETGSALHTETWGGYAFGHYQFALNWYVGLRGDYTEFPDRPGDWLWGASPYVTWYLTEFLRLRFQYQHNEFREAGVRGDEDNFFLNLTFTFGSHPPHPYWVNR